MILKISYNLGSNCLETVDCSSRLTRYVLTKSSEFLFLSWNMKYTVEISYNFRTNYTKTVDFSNRLTRTSSHKIICIFLRRKISTITFLWFLLFLWKMINKLLGPFLISCDSDEYVRRISLKSVMRDSPAQVWYLAILGYF